MDFRDRPAADDFLASRNDVMTVYRDVQSSEGRLFPLRYVRSGFQSALPTVMVVPGGPGSASVFPYELLRRDMTHKGLDVLMMEHRGVGMSRADAQGRDLPEHVMSIHNVLEDMRAVLDHAGVQRAVLVGSSYGAHLVQRFALAYPERVHALVLDSPLTGVRDTVAFTEQLRAMYFEGTYDHTESIARAMRRLVRDQIVPVEETGPVLAAVHEYGGVTAVRELVDLLVLGRGQLAWASIQHIITSREWFNRAPYVFENDLVGRIGATELGLGSTADFGPLDPLTIVAERTRMFPPFEGELFDLETERSRITAPTLVLTGERDLVVPAWRAKLAAESIPGARATDGSLRLISVPNVGHQILDSHQPLMVVAAHWAAAGAIDGLLARDVRSLRGGVVTEAFNRGIQAALLAEKYAPLKLWSRRSLARGPLAGADARGPGRLLSA